MWRVGKVGGFLVGAAFALLASEASAVPVYDTAATLTGTRTLPGGGLLSGGGTFSSATLSWTITSNQNNTLHYSYTIDTNSAQGASHFIFDLSDNCATEPGYCLSNLSMTGGTLGTLVWGTFDGSDGNSNPGMPGSITGLKVNITGGASDFTFAFDSARAPVWGDFYSKGGNPTGRNPNGYALFNAGLGFEATDGSTTDFIAMPDTQNCDPSLCGPPCTANCGGGGGPPPVPEPASIALLGAGLVGASFARRKKKRS